MEARRVTNRRYPAHGTEAVMDGKLTGITSTDYLHLLCPACQEPHGLDTELLEIRADWPHQTLHVGLHCQRCGLTDRVKWAMLEPGGYQCRRMR